MTDPSIQTPPSPDLPSVPNTSPGQPEAPSFGSVLRFTLVFVVFHTVLWLACIGLLVFYVPQAERQFRDYNMTLPADTLFVLGMARWVSNYWYILPLWFPFWLTFEGGFLAILYPRFRLLGRTWVVLNIVLPVLLIAFICIAIEMPRVKLLEGLSH